MLFPLQISGKGGLSPVCEIKWMMSTKIRKEFVLDHQNHPNSGKKEMDVQTSCEQFNSRDGITDADQD